MDAEAQSVARARRRAAAVPLISKVLRSRDFRTSLAALPGGSRHQTVIPVLPDDPISYVHALLSEAGGTGVVALLEADRLRIAALFPASEARLEVATEDDVVIPIHDDITMSFVFDTLCHNGGVAVIERIAARLLAGDGDLQYT